MDERQYLCMLVSCETFEARGLHLSQQSWLRLQENAVDYLEGLFHKHDLDLHPVLKLLVVVHVNPMLCKQGVQNREGGVLFGEGGNLPSLD